MKAIVAFAMNRMKAISASLRILNSSRAIQNQVSRFSPFTPLPPSPANHHFPLPITHQKLHFSPKPNFIAELILTNDWSQDLEHELIKCSPSLTRETVIYVLKRLDKNPEKAYSFFNWVVEKEWFRASSSVFSLIIRVLANKETMKQFWITLRKMKEKGFYLDDEAYLTISIGFKKEKLDFDYVALKHFFEGMQENAMESVVTKLVDIILRSEWDHKVESELAKVKIQLSDDFVIRVLKVLRDHPLKAYKFFNWVGKQSGYQHNTVTYNAIARVLARPGWIVRFWSIIAEMKSASHELDIDTYIMISNQLQKTKMVKDAVSLYERMMDGPHKPSVQHCIFLLKSISASDRPDLDLVFRVANKFEATGHTLPKAMRNAGFEPDNITYCQLVFVLCKMRRLEEAYEVLEEMESCGFIPDVKTWTILIKGHCDAGEVDQALLCFVKMLQKGSDADADLLDVLVEGLLTQKRMDDAYKLFRGAISNCRISPCKATYKKMIEKLLGDRKFEEALDLLRLMKNHNYRPHHEPFEKLFESLLRIRKFEEALDLFVLTRKHKYPLFDNPVLFVSHVSRFGTVDDALKYLKAWSKGNPVSHSAYLRVFKSFIQEGRVSEAKDLLCKCPSRIRHRKRILELFASV